MAGRGCVVGAAIGPDADALNIIANAVSNLGFVHVAPIRDAVSVTFEPSVVSPLAAIAAFYEIAARGPQSLVLTYPAAKGQPHRCEIVNDLIEGLRRLEDAANCGPNASRPSWLQTASTARRHRQPIHNRVLNSKLPTEVARDCQPQIKSRAGDRSIRLSRPLNTISTDDHWLSQLLNFWASARRGWRLPSNESFELTGIIEHCLWPGAHRRDGQLKSIRISISAVGRDKLVWCRIRQSIPR